MKIMNGMTRTGLALAALALVAAQPPGDPKLTTPARSMASLDDPEAMSVLEQYVTLRRLNGYVDRINIGKSVDAAKLHDSC
jgi:hypothetical protein